MTPRSSLIMPEAMLVSALYGIIKWITLWKFIEKRVLRELQCAPLVGNQAAPLQLFQLICLQETPCRQELPDYADTLDQVYELTIKYAPISTVLWLGDLNGSFDRRTPVGRNN